jgi:hypothetical protein
VALPTTADAKSLLRIEHNGEDTLIGQMLVRAQALIETYLGYALTAVARTHIDYNERDNAGLQPVLRLPGPFKTAAPAPVVTDVEGATVDAATYDLDPRTMKIRAKAGTEFPARPYSIVATIGLSVHPDYTASLEAVVSTAILSVTSHLYLNRNPAARSQSDEGGTAVTLSDEELLELAPGIGLLPKPYGGWVFA